MVPRISSLALSALVLAAGIFVIGVPIAFDSFHALSFERALKSTLNAIDRGEGGDALAMRLLGASPQAETEQRDLAFALLALADSPTLSERNRRALLDRAVAQFREYVSKVPGDGRAWTGLASAEIALGDSGRAVAALKASILVRPWSPSLVAWRCGMGIDLFGALDDEGRELLRSQFRLQAVREVRVLVDAVVQRQGARVARILLASSPEQLIAFETELAKRR